MPTYQYACTACGHHLEAVQSFSDEPLTECPACAGRLRKVFNSVGIVFKGSGFYRTDSRTAGAESNGGAAKPAKSDSSTGGSSGSSGGGSADGGSSGGSGSTGSGSAGNGSSGSAGSSGSGSGGSGGKATSTSGSASGSS